MKIAIIGTVGVPAQYGGFETLAHNLVVLLSGRFDFTVYCSSVAYSEKADNFHRAKLHYIPLNANGVQSIFYDFFAIFNSLRRFDVLLILGVSGCILLPFVSFFCKGKIIVNIDGLEWKREKWRGFSGRFLRFSEKIAVKFADIVVADNEVIKDYVAAVYGVRSELIPYGGDHASRLSMTQDLLDKYPFLSSPYAFTVCRIEPENNIHTIIDAMAGQSALPLVMVGNWQSSEYGKMLVSKYRNYSHLHLLGPVYDQSVLDRMRSGCSVYLHGHSAGGTNPSLVEAMFLGLPIIAFDVNYNRETTEGAALYFSDSMELSRIISTLDTFDLTRVAENMRSIAERRYRWSTVADCYARIFVQA